MKNDKVQVTIQVPKGVNDFVEKISALDGSSPEEWYQYWICQEFDAVRDNNFIIEFDAEKMKELYDYES